MSDDSDLTRSEKEMVLSFLESYYDVSRERIDELIVDEFPDNPRDLEFVRDKIIYNSDETVGTLSDEFYARNEYLRDILTLNFTHPPGFRDGYIKQPELSDQNRFKARENPNIATVNLVSDDEYDDLMTRIGDQVSILKSELDNCELEDEVELQFRLVLALLEYSVDTKRSVNIQNAFRPLSYMCSNHDISVGRHEHAYSKIGSKLDHMFDDNDRVADELYENFDGNMKELVRVVENSLEVSEK